MAEQGKLTDENFDLVFGEDANEFDFETEQSSSNSTGGRLQALNPLKQLEKRTSYLVNENYRLKAKMLGENIKCEKKVSDIQEKYKHLPITLQNLPRENVKLKKRVEYLEQSKKDLEKSKKRFRANQ